MLRTLGVPLGIVVLTIAALQLAPFAIVLPFWAETARLELIFALSCGALVGLAAGPGDRRLFGGTLALFAALYAQASLIVSMQPPECGPPGFAFGVAVLIAPALSSVLWIPITALGVAGAFAFGVLSRVSFARRTLAVTLLMLGLTGAIASTLAVHLLHQQPPQRHCLDF